MDSAKRAAWGLPEHILQQLETPEEECRGPENRVRLTWVVKFKCAQGAEGLAAVTCAAEQLCQQLAREVPGVSMQALSW